MSSKSPFEDRLDDWMEDGPNRAPDQVLDTVLAAVPSIPQRRGAWRVPWRSTPMLGFARALAGIAIALALATAALVFLVLRPTGGDVGSSPSPSPAAVAVASASASPSPSPTPSPTLTATPTPTAVPTPGPCDQANLTAKIVDWTGAAGSRGADVTLTNTGSSPCVVRALARPQLVDGRGTILIDGAAPAASSALTIAPGGTLKTLVVASNYCGGAPKAPVTVAFVLTGGGRVVATPVSATDMMGVPPCNGAGAPASITMQPWAP
jgi:hypothetical protein